ncbi:MAG: hypothetical protein J7K26_03295 [Candidatus Aenigmarchaeota archaeon]|nr:hypothetical protein [Candidatus Aenigmarchaeota archaeon]
MKGDTRFFGIFLKIVGIIYICSVLLIGLLGFIDVDVNIEKFQQQRDEFISTFSVSDLPCLLVDAYDGKPITGLFDFSKLESIYYSYPYTKPTYIYIKDQGLSPAYFNPDCMQENDHKIYFEIEAYGFPEEKRTRKENCLKTICMCKATVCIGHPELAYNEDNFNNLLDPEPVNPPVNTLPCALKYNDKIYPAKIKIWID